MNDKVTRQRGLPSMLMLYVEARSFNQIRGRGGRVPHLVQRSPEVKNHDDKKNHPQNRAERCDVHIGGAIFKGLRPLAPSKRTGFQKGLRPLLFIWPSVGPKGPFIYLAKREA